MGGMFSPMSMTPPKMELSGGQVPLSQVDPSGLSQQEKFAYQQAMAYANIKHGGAPPEQALGPQAYQHYLTIMQQYFPNQNFYQR